MNEYAALMYGILIGYGICVIINKRFEHRFDTWVLILTYSILLLLSINVEL